MLDRCGRLEAGDACDGGVVFFSGIECISILEQEAEPVSFVNPNDHPLTFVQFPITNYRM